jgi:hypothetical protein
LISEKYFRLPFGTDVIYPRQLIWCLSVLKSSFQICTIKESMLASLVISSTRSSGRFGNLFPHAIDSLSNYMGIMYRNCLNYVSSVSQDPKKTKWTVLIVQSISELSKRGINFSQMPYHLVQQFPPGFCVRVCSNLVRLPLDDVMHPGRRAQLLLLS